MKTLRVVSLACDMPTGPPLHPTKYDQSMHGYQCYRVLKDEATIFLLQGR